MKAFALYLDDADGVVGGLLALLLFGVFSFLVTTAAMTDLLLPRPLPLEGVASLDAVERGESVESALLLALRLNASRTLPHPITKHDIYRNYEAPHLARIFSRSIENANNSEGRCSSRGGHEFSPARPEFGSTWQ